MYLNPVTNLSTEWLTKSVIQGSSVGRTDLRQMKSTPTSDTLSAMGKAGSNLRASRKGDYYITCKITWGVPNEGLIQMTGGIAYAKVTVRDGQTTKAIVRR